MCVIIVKKWDINLKDQGGIYGRIMEGKGCENIIVIL